MARVGVIYVRGATIGSVLIRAASWWEPWSHCGWLLDDRTVINARAFHGVVEEPVAEFLQRYTEYSVVHHEVPNPKSGHDWVRSQLGSGYDYGAIAGIVLREPLGKKSRWQCVELVETGLKMAGVSRFRIPPDKLTVAQSYNAI